MRILLVHNFYMQSGGEDRVFTAEGELLERFGHEVVRYTVHNDQANHLDKLDLALKTLWNKEQYRKLRELFRKKKPDVVHFHNIFPLISSAAYYAAQAENIPVIQTLHNYRLLCPGALLFRNDLVCEDCLDTLLPWRGILHSCYRQSRSATSLVVTMLVVHRLLKTWSRKVNVFIALTEFSRSKFIQGGLPAERIMVKPNFVESSLNSESSIVGEEAREGFALFVGRISREKGIETLLKAWKIIGRILPLRIVGDGPLAPFVQEAASTVKSITWLGQYPIQQVYELMSRATVIIFSSECYESMPRTIIEAFAQGTPVVSSNMGSMSDIVGHGRTGLHFEPGNAEDLVAKIEWILAHPEELSRMRRAAKTEYQLKYTEERNHEMLMSIYETAIKRTRGKCAYKLI